MLYIDAQINTGEEDNKKLVILPERLFVHARLGGSEEADPNDPKAWGRMVAGPDNRKHLSTQDTVTMHQNPKKEGHNSRSGQKCTNALKRKGLRTRTARLSFPEETI